LLAAAWRARHHPLNIISANGNPIQTLIQEVQAELQLGAIPTRARTWAPEALRGVILTPTLVGAAATPEAPLAVAQAEVVSPVAAILVVDFQVVADFQVAVVEEADINRPLPG
jgi:hypothetical protein